LRLLTILAVFAVALASEGCSMSGSEAGSSATPAAENAYNDTGGDGSGVDVPSVVGEDGASAVSDAVSVGLTTSLVDGTGEDDGFDASRDPSGCEVIDQNPAAGANTSEGDEIEISLDCRQTDWENREGSAWESYNDAYSSAFDDGCQELFDISPAGSLYEDGVEYTAVDCQSLNPGDGSDDGDLPSDAPDDPESVGTELGESAGCRSLFDEQGVGSLNYGTDSFTADDCPIAVAPTSSGAAGSKSYGSRASHHRTSDLYRVSLNVWNGYDRTTKLKAARSFLHNNPRDCGGRGITPQHLVNFADAGGLGDTRGRPINEVMIVLCSDAALSE
jgi:hypothetical protein